MKTCDHVILKEALMSKALTLDMGWEPQFKAAAP